MQITVSWRDLADQRGIMMKIKIKKEVLLITTLLLLIISC